MGKCCSVDRSEFPDENVQIIRMRIPKTLKQPRLEELNNNNEKQISEMLASGGKELDKSISKSEVKTNVVYDHKLEDQNEENEEGEHQEEGEHDEEDLNDVPDQEIRRHVFS